jgi:hypothetical protein
MNHPAANSGASPKGNVPFAKRDGEFDLERLKMASLLRKNPDHYLISNEKPA